MNSQNKDIQPTHMLLVLISKLRKSSNLTNETIYDVFQKEGSVRRILIFKRGNINKAFVECWTTEDATNIKLKLDGSFLMKNKGKLLIHFSNVPEIDINMVDNSRATEYENPANLVSTSDEHSVRSKLSSENIKISKPSIISLRMQLLSNNRIIQDVSPTERVLIFAQNLSEINGVLILNYFVIFGEILMMYSEESQNIIILEFKQIDSAILAKEYGHNQMIQGIQMLIKYLDDQSFQQLREYCKLNSNWIQNIPLIGFRPPTKKVYIFSNEAQLRQNIEKSIVSNSPIKILNIFKSMNPVHDFTQTGFTLVFRSIPEAICYISYCQRQIICGKTFFAVYGD